MNRSASEGLSEITEPTEPLSPLLKKAKKDETKPAMPRLHWDTIKHIAGFLPIYDQRALSVVDKNFFLALDPNKEQQQAEIKYLIENQEKIISKHPCSDEMLALFNHAFLELASTKDDFVGQERDLNTINKLIIKQCTIHALSDDKTNPRYGYGYGSGVDNLCIVKKLDCKNAYLTRIPAEVFNKEFETSSFRWGDVRTLDVSDNCLTVLPETLKQLRLCTLDASNNQLTALPSYLEKDNSSFELNIALNNFSKLPNKLGDLIFYYAHNGYQYEIGKSLSLDLQRPRKELAVAFMLVNAGKVTNNVPGRPGAVYVLFKEENIKDAIITALTENGMKEGENEDYRIAAYSNSEFSHSIRIYNALMRTVPLAERIKNDEGHEKFKMRYGCYRLK